MNISDAEIKGLIDYCTAMVYRRYRNFPFVDDLIETVPTSVWSAVKKYKPEGAKLSTICIQMTYWRCQDVISNNFLTRDGEFRPDYTVDVDSDVMGAMAAESVVNRRPDVDTLLELLGESDRELLKLHYLKGMKLVEIAAIKCVTPQWVCICKNRALRRLRAKIRKSELRSERLCLQNRGARPAQPMPR